MAPVERNELAGPVEPCSQSHDASPLILVDHVRNAGGGAMPLQNTSIKRVRRTPEPFGRGGVRGSSWQPRQAPALPRARAR